MDPLHVGAAMTDPQQWNRYAYARNNPLGYGDPTGLCAQRNNQAIFCSGVDVYSGLPGGVAYFSPGAAIGNANIDWGFGMSCGGEPPNGDGWVPRIQDGNCYGWEYVGWEPPSYDDPGPAQTVPSSGTSNGDGDTGSANGGNGGNGGNTGNSNTTERPSPPCSGAASFGPLFGGGSRFGISSGFGPRVHPISGVRGAMHNGLDIRSPQGTVVFSPIDGVVRDSRFENNGGGNTIRIQGSGPFSRHLVGFGHLFRLDVAANQPVTKGMPVALSGGTPGTTGAGGSDGPHLHFSVKIDGVFINPAPCYN